MSDAAAPPTRSTRRVPLWPLVAVLVVAVVAALVWRNAKHGHIDLPPSSASPQQVVEKYAEALNADDCVSASMLAPSVGARWCGTHITDLAITGTSQERRPMESGSGPVAQRVRARLTTAGGRDVPQGEHTWHFMLAQTGPGGAWRIYEQGRD